MKYRLSAFVLAAVCVFLSGCGWIRDEYTSVKEHKEPYVYTEPEEDEAEPTAENAGVLKNRILSFVRKGISNGRIDITEYSGDAHDEIVTVLEELKSNPVYAYAVDYSDYEFLESEGKSLLEIRMVFRRSAEEISAIMNVRGQQTAQTRVLESVESMDSALTLKVSEYTETDFEAQILRFCLENPTLAPQLPEVSVQVYPEEGDTRIVELHFGYTDTREELRSRKDSLDTTLNSAARAVFSESDTDCLHQLCTYLLERDEYTAAEKTESPVYQLLTKKQASDMGFASAVFYILNECGVDCRMVIGEKNGAPYCWNIVCIAGQYFHLDLRHQWENDFTEPQLFYDSQMNGYQWDTDQYPRCMEISAQPETEETKNP